MARCEPRGLIGVDRSEGFLREAERTTRAARARFAVADAAAIPVASAALDVAVSGLMLNFAPQPAHVLQELRRVVRPGGTVSAYVWDYAGGMEFMRVFWDAAAALRPEAADLDEGRRFPLCRSDALARLFRESGLFRVEVRAIDVPTRFRDFDDYWAPVLGGQGPAPTYLASLAEADRVRLRERIHAALVPAADGSIALTARAWAVRGTNPAAPAFAGQAGFRTA
jgi:SAM-dependent methyltransferase